MRRPILFTSAGQKGPNQALGNVQMRKITVVNHLSLDGVMQAPGRPDEDTRGGFTHGGWAAANNDEVMGRKMGEGMATGGALLVGRRTYEDFYSFWPKQKDNPFTGALNAMQKYVVSSKLEEPLPWENSTLLKDTDAAAALKKQDGDNLLIFGSGVLIEALMERGLIDEFLLMIHPLILGKGRRLFNDGAAYEKLELVDSVTTTRGVLMATYRPGKK